MKIGIGTGKFCGGVEGGQRMIQDRGDVRAGVRAEGNFLFEKFQRNCNSDQP